MLNPIEATDRLAVADRVHVISYGWKITKQADTEKYYIAFRGFDRMDEIAWFDDFVDALNATGEWWNAEKAAGIDWWAEKLAAKRRQH